MFTPYRPYKPNMGFNSQPSEEKESLFEIQPSDTQDIDRLTAIPSLGKEKSKSRSLLERSTSAFLSALQDPRMRR